MIAVLVFTGEKSYSIEKPIACYLFTSLENQCEF